MPHIITKVLAMAASLLFAASAEAATFYSATLLGANENPSVLTPGTGTAFLTLDGDLLSINIEFQDLIGSTTASHVHCCQPAPTNAGVATPVPTFPGFPLGVTSGIYNQTFDLTLASSYNPAFITNNGGTVQLAYAAFLTGLNSNMAYVNVHTSAFPGGEIRGQITAVPEPAAWALMITGFALVGTAIRRRRSLLPA